LMKSPLPDVSSLSLLDSFPHLAQIRGFPPARFLRRGSALPFLFFLLGCWFFFRGGFVFFERNPFPHSTLFFARPCLCASPLLTSYEEFFPLGLSGSSGVFPPPFCRGAPPGRASSLFFFPVLCFGKVFFLSYYNSPVFSLPLFF